MLKALSESMRMERHQQGSALFRSDRTRASSMATSSPTVFNLLLLEPADEPFVFPGISQVTDVTNMIDCPI